ncbi:MAG: XTP/dITP diphosphatase [bacterium]|nr:XTP/dITP diphosphatase [bacterium]
MKVIAATNNKGKLREFGEILSELDFEVISLHEAGIYAEVEETGSTFEENALIKARSVAILCDLPVIADDSGLCVDALDGQPGVYSARWAGNDASDAQRIDKLLEKLEGVEDRTARFVSVVAFVDTDGTAVTSEGVVEGTILYKPVGNNGFGYDPVFFSTELQRSFAEASDEAKNSVSHRGRALRGLCKLLRR